MELNWHQVMEFNTANHIYNFVCEIFFLRNCWQYSNKKAIKQYNDCHDIVIVIGIVPLHVVLELIYGRMIGMLIGTKLSSVFMRQKMSSVCEFSHVCIPKSQNSITKKETHAHVRVFH